MGQRDGRHPATVTRVLEIDLRAAHGEPIGIEGGMELRYEG